MLCGLDFQFAEGKQLLQLLLYLHKCVVWATTFTILEPNAGDDSQLTYDSSFYDNESGAALATCLTPRSFPIK